MNRQGPISHRQDELMATQSRQMKRKIPKRPTATKSRLMNQKGQSSLRQAELMASLQMKRKIPNHPTQTQSRPIHKM